MNGQLRYFSTFSGIGGFELGIAKAANHCHKREVQTEPANGGAVPIDRGDDVQVASCAGYSEIDKYAIQIYKQHFPNHTNFGDITKINEQDLPDFDLFVGGFPCQAFSIAGKRRGFEDTRGTLFFDIARILAAKQPRLFLLENVKGLLSHNEGRTFITIITTLDELGYDLQWQVLNSKDFGVPQNRERVFIVGHLRGTPRPQVFPICGGSRAYNEVRVTGRQGNSRHSESPQWRAAERRDVRRAGTIDRGRFKETGGIALNLPASYYKGHDNHGARPMVAADSSIRRLTPPECERLQGFPDDWTKGLSDTQRYKCLGNAVTVNVIEAICGRLLQ